MKKRNLLLTLMLALCCLSSFAYDNAGKFTKDGITYEVMDNKKFTVRTYSADESALVGNTLTVPAKVHDPEDDAYVYTVVEAKFYGDGRLPQGAERVVLSEGIKSIASFYRNSQVKYIYFPESLEEFSVLNLADVRVIEVASGNPYFEFVYEDESRDPEAGFLMSKDGKKLLQHIYPTTQDFYKTDDETTNGRIIIPDGVEYVHENAFQKDVAASGARVIHLGKDVSYYGATASSSSVIRAFEVDPLNKTFHAEDGVLYMVTSDPNVYDLHAYPHGKNDKKFVVWEKCKVLKTQCLEDARIEVIDLNKVETVKNNAFRFSSIKTVIFTDAVKEFTNSQSSANSVNYIYRDNVNDDGTMHADGTWDFKEGWDNDKTHSNFHIVNGILFSKDESTIISVPCMRLAGQIYEIPEGVTTIHTMAFEYSHIKKIISNEELETIENNAFQYSYIEEGDFSASDKLLSMSGFYGSEELSKITLSPSITSIAGFGGCTSLEEIHVPDGSQLRSIGSGAFSGLNNFRKFVFDGSAPYFTTVNSRAFANCTSLEYVNLPSSVVTIGPSAFSGCTSLETVSFTDTVTDHSSIKKIARNAFSDSGLKTITIPSSVETIEAEAFKNCNVLETVSIPAATTSISPETFKFCTKLQAINVDKENPVYSSVDGFLLSKYKETLKLFPPGKANDRFTLLPPSITEIGEYSFYSCVNLKNVTIPNKVGKISDRAFGLCDQLNTITFLCDEMIDPENIDMRLNHNAFDEGIFKKININVRMDLLDTYKNTEFYQQFKSINPSFRINEKNEYIAVSDQAVDLLDIKEQHHTYVVPATVKDPAGKDMIVALIGDYACQNTPEGIEEIVTFNNVEYIGAKAFKQPEGKQSIKNLFFCQAEPTKQLLSTTRFELTPADLDGDDQYKEFEDDMKIYVRKKAYEKCTTDWAAYANMIDYKIKDMSVSTKYGTFSREFDVDLSQCLEADEEVKGKKVLAFTALLNGITEGNGDYGTAEYHITMQSINCDAEGDGTYIPKNTGVLLKVMDANATDENTFYTISDRNDDNLPGYAGTNAMKSVTVDPQTIDVTTASSIYVMSGGLFRYVNPENTSSLNMPIHKAYLELSGAPAGAKVVFDEGDATGIEDIEVVMPATSEAIYNLQGQRVNGSAKGIVIKNGKKIFVK